jgi:hypothetical protein
MTRAAMSLRRHAAPTREARPLARALLWLTFLAPFFYATYGAANYLASLRGDVGAFVFGWERHIPFIAWTIIPYWSINLFYGLSLLICLTRAEVDALGRRLLTAQMIAVTCFILFPLRFTFARPTADGLAGFLFDALASFDQPFNQAPSLHIALLVILWKHYLNHVPQWARPLLNAWFALVGISVLTTYQHHVIDVPTGALLGFLCLWLWPDHRAGPSAPITLAHDLRRRRLAWRYGAAAAVCAISAAQLAGSGILLLWPALSLAIVAANYAFVGAAGFDKAADGRMSAAAAVVLMPYLLGAFLNSRLWTWRDPAPVAIADDVWLGRFLVGRDARQFATVVDVAAELPRLTSTESYQAVPMLDLVTPDVNDLRRAAGLIAAARARGPVLICCALGFARSAAAAVTWLVMSGRAATAAEAIARLRDARPRIVVDAATLEAIETAARGHA